MLKRAALFSALTGLRHCDIQKLKWSEIEVFNGGYRLNFTQQKTKVVEYMPISEQAFQLCGERYNGNQLVFAGLPDPSWISRPIKSVTALGTRMPPYNSPAGQTFIRSAKCLAIRMCVPPKRMQRW